MDQLVELDQLNSMQGAFWASGSYSNHIAYMYMYLC